MAALVTDLLVVGEPGSEGEQAQCDAYADTGEGAAAVALERELAFAGPNTDSIHSRTAAAAVATRFVFAVAWRSRCVDRREASIDSVALDAGPGCTIAA